MAAISQACLFSAKLVDILLGPRTLHTNVHPWAGFGFGGRSNGAHKNQISFQQAGLAASIQQSLPGNHQRGLISAVVDSLQHVHNWRCFQHGIPGLPSAPSTNEGHAAHPNSSYSGRGKSRRLGARMSEGQPKLRVNDAKPRPPRHRQNKKAHAPASRRNPAGR